MHGRRREIDDWLRLIAPTALAVQATSNSALAITQDLRIASVHSKWPFSWEGFGLVTTIKPWIKAISSLLPRAFDSNYASLRTRVDTTGSTSCIMGSKHSKDRKGGERI